MAIDFPNSPEVGDSFAVGSTSWVWDGTVWNVAGGTVINTIDGLLDVNTTGAESGEFLKYNGESWISDAIPTINSLDDIGDITAPTPTTGDYLKWDGTKWVNDAVELGIDTTGEYVSGVTAGAGVSVAHTPGEGSTATVSLDASLDNLSDVTIVSPSSGETLAYNGSGWVNSPGMPSGSVTQFAGSTAPSGWLSCDGTTVSRTTYAALFAVIGTTYGAGDGSTTFSLPNMKGRIPVGLDTAQTEFDALGEAGGAKTHILTAAEIPSVAAANHTHGAGTFAAANHGHGPGTFAAAIGATNGDANRIGYVAGSVNGPGIATYSVYSGSLLANSAPFNHYTPVYGSSAGASPAVTGTSGTTSANTGGGGAHNNLQPYIVLNYIIKA